MVCSFVKLTIKQTKTRIFRDKEVNGSIIECSGAPLNPPILSADLIFLIILRKIS